jgi:hypothetical protein
MVPDNRFCLGLTRKQEAGPARVWADLKFLFANGRRRPMLAAVVPHRERMAPPRRPTSHDFPDVLVDGSGVDRR